MECGLRRGIEMRGRARPPAQGAKESWWSWRTTRLRDRVVNAIASSGGQPTPKARRDGWGRFRFQLRFLL